MGNFKSGFVSIIGRTNVGKSTLINTLAGQKVAIAVNKSQTTRTAIKAIINTDNSQIIITDTPGIHKPKNKLGTIMNETAFTMVGEVDVVLFVIDATSSEIGKGDRIILDKIKESKKKTILIINKIDLVKKENLLKLIELYRNEYDFKAVIPMSANKPKDSKTVIEEIEKLLPEGPKYYEEDEYTDQTARQLAEEIIREKALKLLNEEVPHGIFVEIEKFKYRKTAKKEDIYDIDATIYCERNSHKGIIIGKNGGLLKKIGMYSRQDIEKMLDTKVNLKLWVKVREEWQENDNFVRKFKL